MGYLSKHSFDFQSIYSVDGLRCHDQSFCDELALASPLLAGQLQDYRAHLMPKDKVSDFLIALAPYLERYMAKQLGIEVELDALSASLLSHDPLLAFKKRFVATQVKKKLAQSQMLPAFETLDQKRLAYLDEAGLRGDDQELLTARWCLSLLEKDDSDALACLLDWCVQAIATPEGRAATGHWVSLKLPKRLDMFNLVPRQATPSEHGDCYQSLQLRRRDGFDLTDFGMSQRAVQNQVHYCVYCHEKETDFCRQGFPVKKKDPEQGLKRDAFGEYQTGCPLDEKISEMHTLMLSGHVLGALAMIMVDNPMCPATGHRICNDCMKSCIYQKQEPVNIPEVETSVLKQVLSLPWGVEIYNWLLRWNPLRLESHQLAEYNQRKVMVMGMGPAGFSLAYYLLMAGCAVVGLDGLKIEPLPEAWINTPIRDYQSICHALSERPVRGFGGVAEYGITVRWDKNFLNLIYLSLMRFAHFQVFGGVRFGGTVTIEDAWDLGFDHLALAVGAGLPRELRIPGSLAPGMRQANDFLMSLQLTGAAKPNAMANLQVRLPALVIGGGLTAVDTATEVQAYYLTQIEKVQHRYHHLASIHGESGLRSHFNAEDLEILDEFLAHASALAQEREAARLAHRAPDLIRLIRAWGGVAILYRGAMVESPAYKRNHEELDKALQEGLFYHECFSPKEVALDARGHVDGLICQRREEGSEGQFVWSEETAFFEAKNLFVATGAKPNIAYSFEHPKAFVRESYEYQAYEENNGRLEAVHFPAHVKSEHFGAFTSYQQQEKRVSFLGDTHPLFHGSVVKAIASAKRVAPKIMSRIAKQSMASEGSYEDFASMMQARFDARLIHKESLAEGVTLLRVAAPQASLHFKPGHFYRLQNVLSSTDNQQDQLTEGVAVLATDVADGTLSFVLNGHGSSTACLRQVLVGDRVALMGPSGVRMRIPDKDQTVLVMATWDSIPLVMSYAKEARAQGVRVLVMLHLNAGESPYWLDRMASVTDALWVGDVNASPQDSIAHQSALAWLGQHLQDGGLDQCVIHGQADRIISWRQWSQQHIAPYCHDKTMHFSSVYGPMQCMLKGVCAQCLVWQKDPVTGARTKAVYSCSWQDQPSHLVDWDNLSDRLKQNHLQEVLAKLWQTSQSNT